MEKIKRDTIPLLSFPRWCPLSEKQKMKQTMCRLCEHFDKYPDGLMKCILIDEKPFKQDIMDDLAILREDGY